MESLDAYQAREAIADLLASDGDITAVDAESVLAASALLPAGRAGRRAFRQVWADAVRVCESHARVRGERILSPVDGTLMAGGVPLPVRIDDVDDDGLVRFTVGKLNARRRMTAWLDLVAPGVLRGDGDLTATLVGLDGQCVLRMPADVDAIAAGLIAIWRRARAAPLPLYPGTSAAFAKHAAAGNLAKAQAKAALNWTGSGFGGPPGESLDPACAELARCFPRWDAAPFADLAVEVYGPMFVGGDA